MLILFRFDERTLHITGIGEVQKCILNRSTTKHMVIIKLNDVYIKLIQEKTILNKRYWEIKRIINGTKNIKLK